MTRSRQSDEGHRGRRFHRCSATDDRKGHGHRCKSRKTAEPRPSEPHHRRLSGIRQDSESRPSLHINRALTFSTISARKPTSATTPYLSAWGAVSKLLEGRYSNFTNIVLQLRFSREASHEPWNRLQHARDDSTFWARWRGGSGFSRGCAKAGRMTKSPARSTSARSGFARSSRKFSTSG